MKISSDILLKGTLWTIGSYAASTALRVILSIVLARLLAPELFGLMLIVITLRTGIEQLSDLGIGQNIIYSKNANDPQFYNTAWTLQLIRSAFLAALFAAAAVPISRFYKSDVLVYVVPVMSLTIILTGLTSVSRPLAQKRLQVVRLNVYELIVVFIGFAGQIFFAKIDRTIWALVYGGLFAIGVATIGSYWLLPNVKQRIRVAPEYFWEIVHFGKWIFLSSIVYFASTNFDRLYLAKVVPLNLLGIYGIARNISELLGGVVARLGNYVLFPFIASHSQMSRADLRDQLAPLRARFLLAAALCFSLFVSTADLAIRLFYDRRYEAASWMLPVLTLGSWFSILANLNESTLLGFGKPSYGAVSNAFKFAVLLFGLPLSVSNYGLLGGVTVVTLVDLARYVPIMIGQRRERFSYGAQDLVITLAMFLLIGFWEWLRWELGIGTSFDSLRFAYTARAS